MAVQVNSVAMPLSMAQRGRAYDFVAKPVVGKNGASIAQVLPYAILTWTWDSLELEEWQWWTTTILSGAASASLTGTTTLVDDDGTEQTYSHVLVNRPTGKLRGNHFENVTIILEQLE